MSSVSCLVCHGSGKSCPKRKNKIWTSFWIPSRAISPKGAWLTTHACESGLRTLLIPKKNIWSAFGPKSLNWSMTNGMKDTFTESTCLSTASWAKHCNMHYLKSSPLLMNQLLCIRILASSSDSSITQTVLKDLLYFLEFMLLKDFWSKNLFAIPSTFFTLTERIGTYFLLCSEDFTDDILISARMLMAFPNSHKLPYDYMVTEVILGEMFALPTPRHLDVFYGSLILELCKLQPQSFPQVVSIFQISNSNDSYCLQLAQSVELLFSRLDIMNGACIDRFSTWFAYHLSNFQFRWQWDDWTPALTMDPLHPKPKFIRETLIRCMRLSFHGKVVEMVPESFAPLIPELPEPINKYADEDDGCAEREVIRELVNQVTTKKNENILEILKKLSDEDAATPIKVEVFANVLLNYASQSFSHLFAALGRYRAQLQALCINEECHGALLKALFGVWKKHPQLLGVAVEKFLKAEIVDCHSVAKWIFSDEMSGELMKWVSISIGTCLISSSLL